MFGGGWGLEGLGGSQDFGTVVKENLKGLESRNSPGSGSLASGSGGSGGNTPSRKREKTVKGVEVAATQRKPFGSPTSPHNNSRSPRHTIQLLNKNVGVNSANKNAEKVEKMKNKGGGRGVFLTNDSMDVHSGSHAILPSSEEEKRRAERAVSGDSVELFRLLSTEGSVVTGAGAGNSSSTGNGIGIGNSNGAGEKCSLSVSDDSFSSSRESSEEVKEESRKLHGKSQGQAMKDSQGQVKNEGLGSARPLESRWSEDDFASLSVSVRTVDAPLKGGSFIMQPETDDLREFGNYREIGSTDMNETGEGEGVEEDGDEEGGSGEEVEGGEGEGEESDSGDAEGDGDEEGEGEGEDSDQDGGTIHKYVTYPLRSCRIATSPLFDIFLPIPAATFLDVIMEIFSLSILSSGLSSEIFMYIFPFSLHLSYLVSISLISSCRLLLFTSLLGRQACRIFIIEHDQRTALRSVLGKLSLNERSWTYDSALNSPVICDSTLYTVPALLADGNNRTGLSTHTHTP